MATVPSGISVYSPKIRDSAIVRKYVSQNGRGYVSVGIFNGADPVDADAGTISLRVWYHDPTLPVPESDDPRGIVVLEKDSTEIVRADIGKYYFDIGPQYTANRGVLTAEWSYQVDGEPFTFTDYLQILDQMPLWERLSESERSIVEQVSWMFGDLYDSTEGGPHLIDEFQTKFNYERIAQLMQIAMARFNTTGFPLTNYGIEAIGGEAFPIGWSGVGVIGTYIEVLRHLARSYVEIPNRPNMNVTYVDRSSYQQRWLSILADEEPRYRELAIMTKRSLLGLGHLAMIVSGGIYGYGAGRGLFQYGLYSAQVRSFRFYPAAPAVYFGATH
jgi:hypothetical protein